jgi:hypothetical protein
MRLRPPASVNLCVKEGGGEEGEREGRVHWRSRQFDFSFFLQFFFMDMIKILLQTTRPNTDFSGLSSLKRSSHLLPTGTSPWEVPAKKKEHGMVLARGRSKPVSSRGGSKQVSWNSLSQVSSAGGHLEVASGWYFGTRAGANQPASLTEYTVSS